MFHDVSNEIHTFVNPDKMTKIPRKTLFFFAQKCQNSVCKVYALQKCHFFDKNGTFMLFFAFSRLKARFYVDFLHFTIHSVNLHEKSWLLMWYERDGSVFSTVARVNTLLLLLPHRQQHFIKAARERPPCRRYATLAFAALRSNTTRLSRLSLNLMDLAYSRLLPINS